MGDNVIFIDNRTIILEIEPRSRVVSFKIPENLLNKFDRLIKVRNIGNRSFVLKKLVYLLAELLDKVGEADVSEVCMTVKFMNNLGKEDNASVCTDFKSPT